jgi:hypothetical protein
VRTPSYSDYIVYVDESGDHGLLNINPEYPVFALVFLIFKKAEYTSTVVPCFQKLKFDFFGHDCIVLHAHDIRKEKGPFALLRTDATLRGQFYDELNSAIKKVPFTYFASVIDKRELIKKYTDPYNPYYISLRFCMEKTHEFLLKENQSSKQVSLVVESRGQNEDKQLELEFRRIIQNQKKWGWKDIDFSQIVYNPIFADKQINSTGLQIADLIARPVALSILKPKQSNRAMDIIREKTSWPWAIKKFP